MEIERTWSQFNPVRILFGRGCRSALMAQLVGKSVLLVCTKRSRRQLLGDPLLDTAVKSAKRIVYFDSVEPNPDIEMLQLYARDLSKEHLECVVAFGGGSVIDAAKCFALALSPLVKVKLFRELVINSFTLAYGSSLPVYALPTTAGTGAEVTPFATVWDNSKRQKLSIAGPALFPHSAFIDPELSVSVPYNVTLSTGLDAINQSVESIWNRNLTPLSEIFAHQALYQGLSALPSLLIDLKRLDLREIMAQVSLLSGLAISQTRTSICHSISYPLTAHFGIPHGLACAFTMPTVLQMHLRAADNRFYRLADAIFSCDFYDKLERLLASFQALNHELQVNSRVRSFIPNLESLLNLKGEMFTSGRIDNSLLNINPETVEEILRLSWSQP
jgi:phosphonate metabolism-associated iron-containing alcohol dehydrogenase